MIGEMMKASVKKANEIEDEKLVFLMTSFPRHQVGFISWVVGNIIIINILKKSIDDESIRFANSQHNDRYEEVFIRLLLFYDSPHPHLTPSHCWSVSSWELLRISETISWSVREISWRREVSVYRKYALTDNGTRWITSPKCYQFS